MTDLRVLWKGHVGEAQMAEQTREISFENSIQLVKVLVLNKAEKQFLSQENELFEAQTFPKLSLINFEKQVAFYVRDELTAERVAAGAAAGDDGWDAEDEWGAAGEGWKVEACWAKLAPGPTVRREICHVREGAIPVHEDRSVRSLWRGRGVDVESSNDDVRLETGRSFVVVKK